MQRTSYKHYLIVLLTIIFALNTVDRLALGLVLQDIKSDLTLTDTQLGLLSGVAYGLFYALMGIPIARWADRGNRVLIIGTMTALWSAAVVLFGMASTFVQLMFIRVCTAVGEAGCVPPAHSLIADYFSRAERTRAFSRYMLGVPTAVVVGYFLAGWLNELYGWRVTFIALGLPGIPVALVAALTLKEPRKYTVMASSSASLAVERDTSIAASAGVFSLREVSAVLWHNSTFRYMLLGSSVCSFFNNAIQQWQPVFFVRSFGLHTGELGGWLTLVGGRGALLGTYLGGSSLSTRYAANNETGQLKAIAIAYVAYRF